MMGRRSIVATIIGLALLSGCTGASLSATPAGSEGSVPEIACPALDLLSPAGDPVHLTGRWRSRDGGTYYLRQSNSCVWITGFSVDTGAPGGEGSTSYTNAFFGHLAADFTFSGAWADMPWGREVGFGADTWELDFADVGGVEATTLRVAGVPSGAPLTLVEPDDEEMTLPVRLEDHDSCAMVTSDTGEDYELFVVPPGWQILTPNEVIGPEGAMILAQDAFEISGEVALGTGDCGPGQLFIADRIEPAPEP